MSAGVKAPWTADQVDNINRFQRCGQFHPFTCPGHEGGGDRDLIATRSGWVCAHCDYKQDWAHEGMVNFTAEMAEKVAAAQPSATKLTLHHWHPIETAPDHFVDLTGPHGRFADCRKIGNDWISHAANGSVTKVPTDCITHWMDRPDPPLIAEKQGGAP